MGEAVDQAGLGVIGKMSHIEVQRALYERVTIEDDQGVLWLEGAGPDVTLRGEAAWSVMPLDFSLLCSLHNAVTEPREWDPMVEPSLFIAALTDAQRFDAWVSPAGAVAWCKKYDLPLVQEYRETSEGWLADRLPLRTFQEETVRLYLWYQLWKVMAEQDESGLNRYLPALNPHRIPRANLDVWSLPSKVSLAKQQMNRDIGLNIRQVRLTLTLYEADPPQFRWRTTSLFNIAYLELALLITRQEPPTRVKSCRGCLRLFAGHGNGWYCAHCDRRTIWSRKKRQPAGTL
jgi:hypothetical protein